MRPILRFSVLAALAAGALSCQSPASTPAPPASSTEVATLTVRTAAPSRSISPDWGGKLTALQVTLTGLDGQPGRVQRLAPGETARFAGVSAGRWRVTAQAEAQGVAVAFAQSPDLTLTAAGKAIDLALSGARTKNSSYVHPFSLPDSTGVDGVRAQLLLSDRTPYGPVQAIPLTASAGLLSGTISGSAPAADYRLQLTFLRGIETALQLEEDLSLWDDVVSDLWTRADGQTALLRSFGAEEFAGSDTRLGSVELTDGGAVIGSTPTFATLTTDYQVFAGPNLTLRPYGTTSGQTLAYRVNSGSWNPLTTGTTSLPFTVTAGDKVDLRVIAPSGAGDRTYTFTVTGSQFVYSAPDAETGTAPTDPAVHTRGQIVLLADNTGSLARSGFTFAGWIPADNPGAPVSVVGTGIVALEPVQTWVAAWTPVSAAIEFDPAGGGGTMASQAAQQGVPTSLAANTFTRTGYGFTGWNTASDGSGTSYAPGATVTVAGTVLKLYARWSPLTFQIAFHPEGGSGTMTNQSVVFDSPQTLKANSFTRQGFVFDGWSAVSGGPLVYAPGAPFSTGASDTDLWAHWVLKDVVVHFDANGGSGTIGDLTLKYTQAANLPPNTFTRDGYAMMGWATGPLRAVTYSDRALYTAGADDATLYAVWSANSYLLSFNTNGGSPGMMGQNRTYGSTSNLPAAAFTKAGYTFAGWAAVSGGSVVYQNQDPYTMGSAPATLWAVWTPNTYQVDFQPSGGSGTMTPQTFIYGIPTALASSSFSRAGYTFTGWAVTSGGGKVYNDQQSYSVGTANATLWAVWTGQTFTVTFHAEGGTGSTPAESVTMGTPKALTANGFSRTNYSFGGWALSSGGAAVYSNGASYSTPAANSDLYAVWVPDTHTVTFLANTGTGTMAAQNLLYGVPTALNASAFTKTGNSFAGWATTAGGAVSVAEGGSYTIGAANVSLYAKWTANTYQVTFQAQGGTGTMSAQSFTYGTPAPLSAVALSRTGYAFAGWATTPGGAVVYAGGASYTTPASDAVLYAVWTPQVYPVTFNANGGSGSMASRNFTYDSPAALPAVGFTRSGYTFAGWSAVSSGPEQYIDQAPFSTPASATLLYAVWKVQLTVSFAWGSYQTLTFSNPTPSVARGGTVVLTPSFSGGSNWKWYQEGTLVGSGSSYSFSSATPGVYHLSVLVMNGTTAYSGSVTVTVN